ncbi:unnamed protein product, partial [Musa acuminata var. zebrina]
MAAANAAATAAGDWMDRPAATPRSSPQQLGSSPLRQAARPSSRIVASVSFKKLNKSHHAAARVKFPAVRPPCASPLLHCLKQDRRLPPSDRHLGTLERTPFRQQSGRSLLLDRDPLRRHHFQCYHAPVAMEQRSGKEEETSPCLSSHVML